MLHGTPTFFSRPDVISTPLHVVTVLFNPPRFRTRWKHYEDFAHHVEQSGAILHTAEVAFGERAFSITQPDNPRHLQLRTSSEVWLKERALNLLIQRLPADWKYVAWIDADVHFIRDDWADETLHALQHYAMVQMWSEAFDMGPDQQVVQLHRSFADCYSKQLPKRRSVSGSDPYYYYQAAEAGPQAVYWHPGYAWAARREAFDALGGLIDFCILGSADYHMANALVGTLSDTLWRQYHDRYSNPMLEWEARATAHIRRNIGVVPGALIHRWHGSKANRNYDSRSRVLAETQFNPDVDLKPDSQGLWQLTPRSIELRDRVRRYFSIRHEDSIDLTETEEGQRAALWAAR